MRFVFFGGLAGFFLLAAAGCTKSESEAEKNLPPEKRALIQRGQFVYQSVCTACHNANPKQAGTLGPEVKNSSLELLTARILSADYPAGYKPKRTTKIMVALPQLKPDVPAIFEYLNTPE